MPAATRDTLAMSPQAHRLILALMAMALTAPGAHAQTDETCPLTDGASNCVRILACIGETGRWFHGRALGRGTGVLAGAVNDGVLCTGSWTARNAFGLGQADATCDDDMRVTVLYTYQEEYTGTAIGRGVSNRGEPVKAWSGLNVLDYLRREAGRDVVVLPCGPVDIPIG